MVGLRQELYNGMKARPTTFREAYEIAREIELLQDSRRIKGTYDPNCGLQGPIQQYQPNQQQAQPLFSMMQPNQAFQQWNHQPIYNQAPYAETEQHAEYNQPNLIHAQMQPNQRSMQNNQQRPSQDPRRYEQRQQHFNQYRDRNDNYRGRSNSNREPFSCYNCGNPHHKARDCPMRDQQFVPHVPQPQMMHQQGSTQSTAIVKQTSAPNQQPNKPPNNRNPSSNVQAVNAITNQIKGLNFRRL